MNGGVIIPAIAAPLDIPTAMKMQYKWQDHMLRYQWCRNITIDGHFFIEGFLGLDWFPSSRAKLEAEQYERAVYRQLDQIMRNNYAGYGVLQTIGDTGKSVKIVPDSKWEKKRIEGAHATIQGWDGVRNIPASAIAGGAPSLIEFSPDSGGSLKCHAGNKAARQPDEILLHELVHAMRYCQGKSYSEALPDKSAALIWGNLEEFLAILVTNVYMSEKNRGQLRGQWITTTSDCDYLPPSSATSQGFLRDPRWRGLIARLFSQEDSLFRLIAGGPAAFNPIQEYVRNPNPPMTPSP